MKQKGIDPSLIDSMEMEYTNAEVAQELCDPESAQIHLGWIIQAAPEPHILAAILLLPIYVASERTRRTSHRRRCPHRIRGYET